MIFGSNQCQFVRTSKSIIDLFEFAGVTDDIHCIEEFTEQVYRFNTIKIGNRNFRLFRDLTIDKLKGLQISPQIIC
jgi:hypothetical protein